MSNSPFVEAPTLQTPQINGVRLVRDASGEELSPIPATDNGKNGNGTVGIVFVTGLGNNDGITVLALDKDGPASRTGSIGLGDIVCDVDGAGVSDLSISDVRRLVQGPVGSVVSMTFQRANGGGERYTVRMVRELPSVSSPSRNDNGSNNFNNNNNVNVAGGGGNNNNYNNNNNHLNATPSLLVSPGSMPLGMMTAPPPSQQQQQQFSKYQSSPPAPYPYQQQQQQQLPSAANLFPPPPPPSQNNNNNNSRNVTAVNNSSYVTAPWQDAGAEDNARREIALLRDKLDLEYGARVQAESEIRSLKSENARLRSDLEIALNRARGLDRSLEAATAIIQQVGAGGGGGPIMSFMSGGTATPVMERRAQTPPPRWGPQQQQQQQQNNQNGWFQNGREVGRRVSDSDDVRRQATSVSMDASNRGMRSQVETALRVEIERRERAEEKIAQLEKALSRGEMQRRVDRNEHLSMLTQAENEKNEYALKSQMEIDQAHRELEQRAMILSAELAALKGSKTLVDTELAGVREQLNIALRNESVAKEAAACAMTSANEWEVYAHRADAQAQRAERMLDEAVTRFSQTKEEADQLAAALMSHEVASSERQKETAQLVAKKAAAADEEVRVVRYQLDSAHGAISRLTQQCQHMSDANDELRRRLRGYAEHVMTLESAVKSSIEDVKILSRELEADDNLFENLTSAVLQQEARTRAAMQRFMLSIHQRRAALVHVQQRRAGPAPAPLAAIAGGNENANALIPNNNNNNIVDINNNNNILVPPPSFELQQQQMSTRPPLGPPPPVSFSPHFLQQQQQPPVRLVSGAASPRLPLPPMGHQTPRGIGGGRSSMNGEIGLMS